MKISKQDFEMMSISDAEAFIRKAVSRFGQQVASEKSIKAAARKISKAMPRWAGR